MKASLFSVVFNFQIKESQIWKQQQEVFLDPNDIEFIPPYFPDDTVIKRDMAINYSNLVRMDNLKQGIILELKSKGCMMTPIYFFTLITVGLIQGIKEPFIKQAQRFLSL